MAAGDVVSALSSVDAGNYFDIQPSAGVEIVIHNITHQGADAELYFYDGSNLILIDIHASGNVGAWWPNLHLHSNNTRYYRVKNISGSARLFGYDGVQTK